MSRSSRNSRQHAAPVHVDRLEPDGVVRALDRIRFERTAGDKNTHDEFWLQSLIFRFPACLPLSEIDAGIESLVPVCMELPLPSGFLDNLYVTRDGDLVLVECKLWRNPEARREVLAQIIDYAHSMSAWSYDDLDRAVRKGVIADKSVLGKSLLEVASMDGDLDEPAFVDAVTRNLKLGRFLLLVVGDGIREGAETLAQYLQSHAGFHFTLSLVDACVPWPERRLHRISETSRPDSEHRTRNRKGDRRKASRRGRSGNDVSYWGPHYLEPGTYRGGDQ